uniref:GH16 domain-containing protein n=1 Tax=Acrobeloides nanus TaxID=290746 RepID=A0A914CQ94_9BILA
MDHLPVGPYEPGSGWHSSPVWPAFWFAGDDDTNGEIDPYEGFNPGDTAYSGIHNWDPAKYGNCTLPDDIEKYFNGSGLVFWNERDTRAITEALESLDQEMINRAIDDWPRRLNAVIAANGGHFE